MRPGTLPRSFRDAMEGLREAWIKERNMRIHVLAAYLALSSSFLLKISGWEFLAVLLAIILVLMAELFNTSIEAVVDLASSSFHPLARIAKDAAAAGVLLASLPALAVGGLVFGPRLALMPGALARTGTRSPATLAMLGLVFLALAVSVIAYRPQGPDR